MHDATKVELIDVKKIFQPTHRIGRIVYEDIVPLVSSVRTFGVICPILIRKISFGKFELIDGSQRLRAAVLCGEEEIPAIVMHCSKEESVGLHWHLHKNNRQIHYFDYAIFYRDLMASGMTEDSIATVLQIGTEEITKKLLLLNHTKERMKTLIMNYIEESVAYSLFALKHDQIDRVLSYIIANHLNTSSALKYIRSITSYTDDFKVSNITQLVRTALRKAALLAEREQIAVQMKEQDNNGEITFLFKIKKQENVSRETKRA